LRALGFTVVLDEADTFTGAGFAALAITIFLAGATLAVAPVLGATPRFGAVADPDRTAGLPERARAAGDLGAAPRLPPFEFAIAIDLPCERQFRISGAPI
jgi:hypothetical protein